MSQRFEGHNLEEALNHAAETLGVERYRISHRVIVEKRGFLGGMKRIVIEADVDENATAPPPPAAQQQDPVIDTDSQLAQPSLVAPRSAPRARDGRSGGGGGGGRGRGDRGRGGRRGEQSRGRFEERGRSHDRGARRPQDDDLDPADFENTSAQDAPEQGPRSDAATGVAEWCEQVLALSKLNLIVRTEENERQVIVRFFGGDATRLLERHGELLDAMQVIANKALVGRKFEKEIEFECGAFKEHRTEDIGQRARDLAERVRRDGREQLMPPMSPIERRIVHLALRDDPDVTTESHGEGFFKRVAIRLRSDGEESSES